MKIVSYIKSNHYKVLFFTLLFGLIIYKLKFLNLPFFWDESWVYAPSLRMMHDNGPSMMPNVIPVEYSRGHPLLFHFLGGVWLKIFGTSLISFHSFALFISVLVIIALFFFTRAFFNEKIALLSSFLLMTLQMFIIQSSFVLPEMLLTLWMLCSVYTFFLKKWWWFILSSTALLLTKESGLALIAAYFFYLIIIIPFIDKSITIKERLKMIGIVFIPVLIAFIWFLIQHIKMGWFLFPEHLGMMTFKLREIYDKIGSFFTFVFNREGRLVLIIPLILLLLQSILKRIFIRHCEFTKQSILIVRLLHFVRNDGKIKFDNSKAPFVVFTIIFILIYFVFSSLNFFTLRYLLVLFPLVFVVISYYLIKIFEIFKPYLAIVIITIYISINAYEQWTSGVHDCNRHYVDLVYSQKQLIDYLRIENKANLKTYASFVFCTNMGSYYSGYVKKGDEIYVTNDLNDTTTRYYVYNNMENAAFEEDTIISKGVTLIKVINYSKAWVKVYKKNN
ncbi:MAG: glycosyltransferase family 39 protein [Bacteroidota bacterium]